MTDSATVRAILAEARDKVSKGWCQNVMHYVSGNKEKFCAVGAMRCCKCIFSQHDYLEAFGFLRDATGNPEGGVAQWNDAPERTQEEVVAAFDRAIAAVLP